MHIPKQPIKISLSVVLSAMVCFSILITMSIMTYTQYNNEKHSLFQNTMSHNLSSAQKMAVTTEALFFSMRKTLHSVTNLSQIRTMDISNKEELQHIFDLVRQSSPYFNSVFWTAETGQFRAVSPYGSNMNNARVTTKWALEALNGRKSYISEPYVSPTGRLIVFISEPVFDELGGYRGMIGGTIYLEKDNILHSIFGSNAGNETDSYSYIVDSAGKLLYHPDQSRVGEKVPDTIVRQFRAGNSGELHLRNTRGDDYLAGYARVGTNGWVIVMQTSERSIMADVNDNLLHLIRGMLVPVAVMLILAGFIAAKIAAPFARLYKITKVIAAGQDVSLQEFKPHWNREADQLNRMMKAAAETLAKQTSSLQQEAITDPLTGLFNRREMERSLDLWDKKGDRYAVLLLDIDHFKAVNDTYGHQTGDEVLKTVANVIAKSSPPEAVCSRYGGEEFVILLRERNMDEVYGIAERIRQTISAAPTPFAGKITVSIGISLSPEHGVSRDEVLQAADMALYRAKREGRDRTIAAE
ncbi:MAG: diguanylate cyclase [Paenibacillus macerans]|uniref:Diguanylate cyclase domain protein n=2 Tax=Paenibacillus macerans TaxID=44252 RepID=A0A090YCB1_PAEMA|nr:sensor domain-containing diguanylate cyclase [Paenibacillus macerans]KFM95831.1 diguanylate cyclase domain protein [Paenibacillus macerans]MCY7558793.1 diguanylate cyclase [Paenibacillus macerans]MDU7474292.1 diguanylate cyclase [Paenibacillus macerans]MEC0149774.1 diguanylate cyclase [Paenibacillus macerans]MEC0332298.1 diguanylate cyclase [Paenibacillus macerans]